MDLRAAALGDVRRVRARRATATGCRPPVPAGSPPSPRSRRTGSRRSRWATPRAGRRHRGDRSASWSAAIPRPPARLLTDSSALPARRQARAAQPRGLEPGRRRARAGGRRPRRADRRALVGRGPGSRAPRPHDRRARRRRRRRRSSRSWSRRPTRSRGRRRRCSPPRPRSASGPRRGSRWPASRSWGRTRSCSSSDARRIGDDADLHWALAQLGGRLVRSRVDNVLAGDRSRVEQVEIVFGSESQLHDLTSYTRHVGRDTTGQLLCKGVLLDRARSYLKGLITIEKSAIGTDSYLGEFGMNLSKSARAVAIPSLEIDQPDCRRAAHASSVGPIDETPAVLPREPRHPARRGPQVHRAGVPRAGRRPGAARGLARPAARRARGEVGRRPRCRTAVRRRRLTPPVPRAGDA